MNILQYKAWSPYTVGVLIGLLSWFAFATVDKPLGITTAFEHSAALSMQAVVPQITQANTYYTDPDKKPQIGWEWMLVVGVFIGAFLSSKLSADRSTDIGVPALWARRFGTSSSKRFAGAFFGAAVMMFGARLAQGCTSGHGISGVLQLAVSSWIFVAVFVPAALLTASALYGKVSHEHV